MKVQFWVKKNISWSKPPNGQFKLNINGSINRDMKKVTTGRVLRDSNGKVNSSFTVDINCCLVVITDLQAIMLGIQIARSRGFKQFMVEFDSCVTILFMNHNCPSFHPCSSVV